MKIYIASSWKNQHCVELLTSILRERGHQVHSFIERAVSDEGRSGLRWDVEQWIQSSEGKEKFNFDVEGATKSDLVIYVGPSGTDAWASGVPVLGLWAKGEQAGLMRHMVTWYRDYKDLFLGVESEKDSEAI